MVTSGALRMYIAFLKQLEERKSVAMEAIREGRVIVGDIDAEASVPVTKQGDLSHYTSTAILERNALATSSKLIDSVKLHFTAMTEHKPSGRRWVTREQYIRYFMLCYSVLYPDSGMTEAQQRCALGQEWLNDAGDSPALTFATFYKSVFEMLDHWCDSVDEAEYVATAEKIGKRVLDDKLKGRWFTQDDPATHVAKSASVETELPLALPKLPSTTELPSPILTTVEPGAATEASQERTSTIVANDSDVVVTDQSEDPRKLDGGIASKPHASLRLKETAKLHPEVKESKPKPPAVTPEPLAAGHRRTKPDAQEAEKPRSKAEIIEEEHKHHTVHPVSGYCEQCALLRQLREEDLQMKIALREAMHARSTETPWINAWGAEVERSPFRYEADPYQDVPANPLAREFDGPSFTVGKGTWDTSLPPLPPKEKRSYIVSPITRPRKLEREPAPRTGTVAAVLKASGARDGPYSPTTYQSTRHEIGAPTSGLLSPLTVGRVALKPRSYMDEIDLLDISETSRSSQTTLSSYRSDASKSQWPASLPAMKRSGSGASASKSGQVRTVAASTQASATKFWSREYQRQFQVPVQRETSQHLDVPNNARLSPVVLDAASMIQKSASLSTLVSPPEPAFPIKKSFLSPIQRTHSYRLLPVTGSKRSTRK